MILPGKWDRVVCFVAAGRVGHAVDVEGRCLKMGPLGGHPGGHPGGLLLVSLLKDVYSSVASDG